MPRLNAGSIDLAGDASPVLSADLSVPDNIKTLFGDSSIGATVYNDGADLITDVRHAGSGDWMIALAAGFPSPDTNAVHIWSGTAGVVTANNTSKLVVEGSNAGTVFISILGPNTAQKGILFGEPASNTQGYLTYFGSSDTPANTLRFGIENSQRLLYSVNAFAFQEATTISTPVNTDLILSNSGIGDIILSPGGNVGIGIASPTSKLHVSVASTGDPGITLGVGSDGTLDYTITRDGGGGHLFFQGAQAGATGYRFLSDDSSVLLAIIDNGDVGIGTATPSGKLEVVGAIIATGLIVSKSDAPANIILERVDAFMNFSQDVGTIQFKGGEDGSEEIVAQIRAVPFDAWTDTSSPTELAFHTTPNGVTSAIERVRINRDGNMVFSQATIISTIGDLTLTPTGLLVCGTGGSLTGTWSDLGIVTTIDINGGSIDGAVIGAAVAAAATMTTLALTDDMTITDAKNIILNTTTGTKLGTGATQKLGFYGAAPVVQQSHIADVSGNGDVDATINSILAQLAALGLQAAV